MIAPATIEPSVRPPWLRAASLIVIATTHAAALGGLAHLSLKSIAPPGLAEIGIAARGELAFEASAIPVPERLVTQPPRQEPVEPEPPEAAPSSDMAQPKFQDTAALTSEHEPDVREQQERQQITEEPPKQAAAETSSPTPPATPVSPPSASTIGVMDRDAEETRSANARYAALVSAEINRRKHYPAQARLRGEKGAVGVSFAIGQSGRVVRRSVTRSSGSSVLDAAAADMVAEARLPPPPTGTFSGEIVITFRVRP